MNKKDQILYNLGLRDEIKDVDVHDVNCTCDACKLWWVNLGPDEDGGYGPFGDDIDDIPGAAAQFKVSN